MQIPESSANITTEKDAWETRALQALAVRNRTWRTLAILALLWASGWVAFDVWRPRQREPLPADFVVDLNLASKAELSLIPGIGPKSADAILAYRQTHGGFTRVEELTRIPGIKEGKLRSLRPYVTVDSRHATR
jgi:competence ComEA-like helix-hairpin-helix protein